MFKNKKLLIGIIIITVAILIFVGNRVLSLDAQVQAFNPGEIEDL